MSWQEFELLVGEGFRQQGYQVIENGGGDDAKAFATRRNITLRYAFQRGSLGQ